MSNSNKLKRERKTSIPDPALWQGPICWSGTPPQPVANYSRSFPKGTTFIRAEVVVTLVEFIQPGMTRSHEAVRPGLLRLSGEKPVEVHLAGFDGQCWTLRSNRTNSGQRWSLAVGTAFPATGRPSADLIQRFTFERIVVQTLLPSAATGKYISFAITDTYETENFASVSDPDPND